MGNVQIGVIPNISVIVLIWKAKLLQVRSYWTQNKIVVQVTCDVAWAHNNWSTRAFAKVCALEVDLHFNW